MNSFLMMILTSTHPLYLFVLIIGCLAVLSTTLYLLYQLNYPRILTYPWNLPSAFFQESTTLYDHYTEVVLAGSYNPPHYGHLEMIAYLARRYKKVHVVIGMNPNKVYQVSPHQRADIIERMVQSKLTEECKLKIKVVVTADYIWRYAKSNGAKILFRGIRTWETDGREERSLHKLNLWGPLIVGQTWPLRTCFLEGKPEFVGISSTLIRKLCGGENEEESVKALKSFVPMEIAKDLYLAYH